MWGDGRVFLRGAVWWVAWYDGRGKEHRESSYGTDKAMAEAILVERIGAVKAMKRARGAEP